MRIVSWFPSTPEMAQGGHSRRLSRDRPRQKDRRLTDPTDYVATLSAQAGDQTGLANDSAVFLMVPDNQFAKLFAVAKIEIKSKCGHAPLKVGKLGGLTNSLADAGDTSDDTLAGAATPNQFSVSNPGTPLSEIVGTCGSIRSRRSVETPSILTLAAPPRTPLQR